MGDETEQIVANLRACLISAKGGIPLPSLDRDYKVLIGHSIPFRKLGFDSLEQFLRSIPKVSISKKNGETVLDAIPSKNTQHLASLVARQKSAPRKVRPPLRMGRGGRTAASQWRPPPSSVRFTPKPVQRRPNSNSRPQLSVTLSQGRTSKPMRQVDIDYCDKNTHDYKCSRMSDSTLLRASNQIQEPESCSFLDMIAVNQESIVSSRQMNYNSYERPPRFLRTPSSEAMVNTSGSPGTAKNSQSKSIPWVAVPATNENMFPPFRPLSEGGIQSMDELEYQVKQLAVTSNQPGSALQARLQKLQIPSVFHLADHLVSSMPRSAEMPDYEQELRELSHSLGLGLPSYTAVPRFPKGESIMYNCKVKVGEESYTSYPDEDCLPTVALQRAARNALKELKKRYVAVAERDSGHSFPVTKNTELIKSRVSELVAAHTAGIWNFQVPLDYRNQYAENLPPNWLDVVRNCPQISVDIIANNRIILNKNVITPVPDADNVGNVGWQQTQSKVVPEPIIFPPGEVWDVYVTCAITTADVWVRLIGEEYNVRYEDMAADMEIHYMENAVPATNPEIGNFYAIKLDDCWHRVELVEMQDNSEALVFFLDHGDEDAFPVNMLHVLEPKFIKLPAQAIQVVLSGLEEFAEDMNATNHLVNTVIGKTLVAQVVSRPTVDDPEAPFSVLLYDTSTVDDINVNRLLAERISEDARAPHLPENGVITEVFVSHLNEEGEVFLNIKSESFNYLQSLMEKLMEGGINEVRMAKAANHFSDPTKLYLARYSVDQEYYRAIIISEPDGKNRVKVQFVDYGNTETLPAASLLLLGQFSETLERFPHQAIKVLLHSVPKEAFGPKFVGRFRELVKEDEPVLVKVMKSGVENSPPEVEMFKRTEDKQFISINNTLALDPELVKPKQASENRLRRRHGGRPHPFDIGQGDHQRGLGVPQIPEAGQYFDVHVTMAANPSNFTVQPYKERINLEDLMSKMQEYYNNHTLTPVSPESVKEGSLFAALHNDGHWYRVTVSNVISGSTVSVYFSDFGDVAFLPLEKLQPLSNQFKTLPAQAIKAKLTRIMPSHGDWSVEDCIRFQERVVEKQFVSVIVDSGPDLLNPSDIVIGLQLYDTSGNVDVEIDGLLVDEKRAVFTPAVLQQLKQAQ